MASMLLPLSLLVLLWSVHAFQVHSLSKNSFSSRWLGWSPLIINKDPLPRRVASAPQMAGTAASHEPIADKMKEHRHLQLSSYGPRFRVTLDHPLGSALHDLPKRCLGSVLRPNLTALLEIALPSPFVDNDKDKETSVYKSKEISAESLAVEVNEDGLGSVEHQILQRLLPTAMGLELRFRKLTIHEKDGHCDFQSETKSQDNHLATLLVEVKSAHKGGRLLLSADGKEFPAIDFSASSSSSSSSDDENIAWIAFYNTDVRHKIEPVTEGTRVVLQFDVLVQHRERSQRADDCFDRSAQHEPFLSRNAIIDDATPLDESKLSRVLSLLDETLGKEQSTSTLALPLFHFYRKEAIRPEFLQSVDRELFSALLKTGLYDVALSPLLIHACTYYREDVIPKSLTIKPSASLADPVDKMYTEIKEDGRVVEVPVGEDHAFNKDISQYITSRRETSEIIDTNEYTLFAIYEYFLGSMLVRRKEQQSQTEQG